MSWEYIIVLPNVVYRVSKWTSLLKLERWVLTIKVKEEIGWVCRWGGDGGNGGSLGRVF